MHAPAAAERDMADPAAGLSHFLDFAANTVPTLRDEWPTVAQCNVTGCLHITNIDGHSFFHFAGKMYKYYVSECVLVALGTQHAMLMHHNANCCLPGCTLFFHSASKMVGFSEKNENLRIVF